MSTLVIVEHQNQVMSPVTRSVIAAAQQLNSNVTAVIVGHQCQGVAAEVASIAGVSSVIVADASCYEHQLAENVSELVASIAMPYRCIMASSSSYGKNTLPRIAARLDVAQVTDVMTMVDGNTFEHPIYAGNAIETVRVLDDRMVLSVRATAFDPVMNTQTPCPIDQLDQAISARNVSFIGHQLTQSKRPELTRAKIVVSGGRGLQNQANFTLVEQLADLLGAAVGASRAAVDAGFVPNDYQVGQTGKVVAPDLYIAIGISGAIQHLAGMKDSKVIVAINKDEDAPIMQLATYRLVGDLFDIVPKLMAALKK